MRTLALAATSMLLLSAVAGCNAKGTSPAPADQVAPALPPAAVVSPAFVVFTGRAGDVRTVSAVLEDGSAPAVRLSTPSVDTTFVAVVNGRRALLAERAADGSITALVSAAADGKDRVQLAAFPAGKYADTGAAKPIDDATVIEMIAAGSSAADVIALRAGAEPRVLASSASLVAAAAGRAAFLAGGDLQSAKLDGSGAITLGGGDGQDEVAEVQGDRLLLTTHSAGAGDVRLVRIDGTGAVDLGTKAHDERAVGLTDTQRIVFLRKAAGGAVLLSASLEGGDQRALTAAALDARPQKITTGGRVFFSSAAGALHAVDASQGGVRVVDPAAGQNVRIGTVQGGHVVYVSDTPHWPALRVAELDGSSVVSLLENAPELPFFGGLMSDGRVVYYRSLAGQLEGGHIYSVKLDGTDRRPVATTVKGVNGQAVSGGPSDQDFEVVTPSGRLILESEFELTGGGSQLVVGAADQDHGRLLSDESFVRFAALIP